MAAYQVTIGERVLRVELRRDGERIMVRVDDGDEQPAEWSTVHGPLRQLVVGERRVELLAARSGDGISVAIAGVEYRAEVVDEAHARLASVAGGRTAAHVRRELKAPMPGLVVAIRCQPGDDIAPGQPLVVLQAMKMENDLTLPRAGRVISISVEPGQTVEQGQVLLVVE
jgi:biotin carboxyl carrier protein